MIHTLTVYCSRDIESRVIDALEAAGVEAYLRVAGGSGHKFVAGQVPRSIAWEATVFVVPAAVEDQLREVAGRLAGYAGSCEVEPCLRVVASPAEVLV